MIKKVSMQSINEFFGLQNNIQEKLKTRVGKTQTVDERNRLYREHCIFTIEEIIEGLRNINHKPWKKTKEADNIEELKDELVDEFRFFLNRCIIMNMSPDELYQRFLKSIKKTESKFIISGF